MLFYFKSTQQFNTRYKINEIVNKFLLAGDKFMLEMHLTLVEHLHKTKKEYEKFKKEEIHEIFIKTN